MRGCLSNALKQWVAAESAATDRYLLGGTARKQCRKMADHCLGSGWSTVDMLEVFRHAGHHDLNLRDVVGGAHGRPLAGVNSQFARDVLTELVAGRAYVAVAITEPDAGTDMKRMESKAVEDGDGFRLTGHKLWNARLRQATHVVVYTLAANGEPGKRSAFLVPIDQPGLKVIDRYAHGLTGNSFGGLEFENVGVHCVAPYSCRQ